MRYGQVLSGHDRLQDGHDLVHHRDVGLRRERHPSGRHGVRDGAGLLEGQLCCLRGGCELHARQSVPRGNPRVLDGGGGMHRRDDIACRRRGVWNGPSVSHGPMRDVCGGRPVPTDQCLQNWVVLVRDGNAGVRGERQQGVGQLVRHRDGVQQHGQLRDVPQWGQLHAGQSLSHGHFLVHDGSACLQ